MSLILHIRSLPHSHQGHGCRTCLPLSIQQVFSLFENTVGFTGTFSSPAPFTLPSQPLRLSNSSGSASVPPSSVSHRQKPLPLLIMCLFSITFSVSLLLLYFRRDGAKYLNTKHKPGTLSADWAAEGRPHMWSLHPTEQTLNFHYISGNLQAQYLLIEKFLVTSLLSELFFVKFMTIFLFCIL